MHDLRDVGGTKGGLVNFLVGLAMTLIGGYLFLDRVSVYGGYWSFLGSQRSAFGITLLPLLFGVGMLFYDGKSKLGWLLTVGGFLVIFAGIVANLQIHFAGASLWATLTMLVLFVGGIGLVLRSLRAAG